MITVWFVVVVVVDDDDDDDDDEQYERSVAWFLWQMLRHMPHMAREPFPAEYTQAVFLGRRDFNGWHEMWWGKASVTLNTLHVEGHKAKGEKGNEGNNKNQRDMSDMWCLGWIGKTGEAGWDSRLSPGCW